MLSYKDTLKLFVRFLINEQEININQFTMKDFTRKIIIEFLEYLRATGCSSSTANQRLAVLKSFANYCQIDSIENMFSLQEVMHIKSKKTVIKEIGYLDETQMRALINEPDVNRLSGLKHKTLLCLLYDTGARVQEICDLKVKDIFLENHPTVKLSGKGNKTRIIPISSDMKQLLNIYINTFQTDTKMNDRYLFLNKDMHQLSRDGVKYIIDKYTASILKRDSTFPKKVTPHMFRYSKSMHMVATGIPIIYIRDFLGHENITTTMIYAKADTRLKEKAINKLAPQIIKDEESKPDWTKNQDLLDFLNTFK
ncbi:tyrosine-type recombinase/integrase [Candidatus Stoquefichus sp. SB1]|uniref:tyrosine-type recombinase/integrase n=1 Tax=Candidatus Stoquefichus sp. SB1 TaxID=1658109 RepID=UPI0018E2BFE2|nr:tyrosine-type recombinase/integrase [Candidatus Stoquefichus sp. SB1]